MVKSVQYAHAGIGVIARYGVEEASQSLLGEENTSISQASAVLLEPERTPLLPRDSW